MDFRFSPEDIAFREDMRTFFAEKLPADLKSKTANAQALTRDEIMRWHGILYEKGWAAPNWPKEYGGPGWSVTEKYILGLAFLRVSVQRFAHLRNTFKRFSVGLWLKRHSHSLR